MRLATLYTTDKQLVQVYGGYIPYHVRKPINVFGSDKYEFIDASDVVKIEHLRVERWVLDYKEHLIALDPMLREIVNSMIGTSEDAVRRIAQVKINRLNDEIKQLQSRTIWDMIRSKFRRKK